MSRTVLAAVGILLLFSGMAAVAVDADYVGNSQCKICHNKKDEGEIWNTWKSKPHASAFNRLGTPEAKAVAEKAGVTTPPQEAPECLRCHVTAFDAKADPHVPAKISMSDGVQCESCHGPASLHVKDGQARKMKKDETVDMSAHIIRPNEQTCVKCHNSENPTWDPNRYTTESGQKVGFDFQQAWKKVEHKIPEKK